MVLCALRIYTPKTYLIVLITCVENMASHIIISLNTCRFAKEKCPSFPDLPPATVLEKLTLSFDDEGLTSVLYSQLMSLGDQNLNKIKTRWEGKFGMELRNIGRKALKRVHSSSSCARLGLIQFKVLHRFKQSQAC